MPDAAPDDSLGPDAEAVWSLPEPEPEQEQEQEQEPEPGWFGRRHPDLWVFGGGAIVAAAAMVVAFAAASGAAATGYSQTPRAVTTQAPVKHAPAGKAQVTGTKAAPAARSPICVSVSPAAASR
jgi:hypothetical protein